MALLSSLLNKLKSPFITEQDEFINHIRLWLPISVIIGVVVGFVMSLFLILIFLIDTLFSFLPQLVTMMIGSIIVIFLVKIKFEEPNKNGLNYVIATKHKYESVPLSETKEFISSGIALGAGLPIGKEGPALVIGSALSSTIASLFKIKKENLHNAITIGSAAATGALFQAPLGAAIFASEVPYKADSDEPMLMVSFLASVIAAVTLKTTIGLVNLYLFDIDIHLFDIGESFLEINFLTTFYAFILGLIIGVIGKLFIDFYYYYKNMIKQKFNQLSGIVVSVVLSLTILFIGQILVPELYLTEGYSSFHAITRFIDIASRNIIWIIIFSIIIQLLVTSIIIASGFPGGIFGPSLSIGALIGIIFAILLDVKDPMVITSYAIIGMSASHAATTKTPIASVLLILEITGLPNLIIPIVMGNIAAYATSGHRSLYENQIHSRDAHILRQLSEYDQLEEFRVGDVMTSKEYLEFTTPNASLLELKKISKEKRKHTFPVLSDDKVVGIITLGDIINALDTGDKKIVSEAMTIDVVCYHRKMTGKEAMFVLIERDIERCPVIDEDGNIEGIVTLKDLLRGHKKVRDMQKKYFS